MKKSIKCILTAIFSFTSLKSIQHGEGCKCNFPCKFTPYTIIKNNCHFNGMNISGSGKVIIGNNFHSGKKIRIITTYHNYDKGKTLPYDNTTYSKDVIIEDNVWVGENVLILGGITIGEGCVIQAGSVVSKSLPPMSVAGGSPAVPFKTRDIDHYNKLKLEKNFFNKTIDNYKNKKILSQY